MTQFLAKSVYRRSVALRLAKYEARKLPPQDAVIAAVDPGGRCIAVLAGGSGRSVPRSVITRAKRVLAEVRGLPVKAERSRRTSRAPRR